MPEPPDDVTLDALEALAQLRRERDEARLAAADERGQRLAAFGGQVQGASTAMPSASAPSPAVSASDRERAEAFLQSRDRPWTDVMSGWVRIGATHELLAAEFAAVRAETVEQAAQACDRLLRDVTDYATGSAIKGCIARIRALAPPQEGKP